MSISEKFRVWAAELAPFPNRLRRAARVAFVTAIGAGLMAIAQINNPLGLTLLVSFAVPELAFSLTTGIAFLVAAAVIQTLTLVLIGALVDSPVVHVCVFIVFAAVSTYLIYGNPKLGRLWLWIQIPTVTAFYLVLFDHHTLGWQNAQMFAGVAIAVALLWLFDNLIWPDPASSVLAKSLQNTLARSGHRLSLLIAIFLGTTARSEDHVVASKLAYHLALLHSASRQAKSVREDAELLADVLVAERIHNRLDRLSVVACAQAGAACDDREKLQLVEASNALESALEEYIVGLDQPFPAIRTTQASSLDLFRSRASQLRRTDDAVGADPSLNQVAQHLTAIGELLTIDSAELPSESLAQPARLLRKPIFPLNRFLVRFCARHTLALTIVFVAGLYDNSPAIHAGLWLLMIGGPPSHGATAKKFTMRAIGASGALIFAALATIILAPNFSSIVSYMTAIFVGVLLMFYVGEGGGELSFLAIGATAFVIAFSGPGPRPDVVGSIWTIWGISFGMIVRAVVSLVSIEPPNQSLAEEFERPLRGLTELVPRKGLDRDGIVRAEMEAIAGIQEMLSIAADVQLEGRFAKIDEQHLVDALDTMRRLAFALGNLSQHELDVGAGTDDLAHSASDKFDESIRSRLESWLASIRAELEPGQMTEAPLRTMVSSTAAPDLTSTLQAMTATDSAARQHISMLIRTLEHQLQLVSKS